jgi:hypothetical protein
MSSSGRQYNTLRPLSPPQQTRFKSFDIDLLHRGSSITGQSIQRVDVRNDKAVHIRIGHHMIKPATPCRRAPLATCVSNANLTGPSNSLDSV